MAHAVRCVASTPITSETASAAAPRLSHRFMLVVRLRSAATFLGRRLALVGLGDRGHADVGLAIAAPDVQRDLLADAGVGRHPAQPLGVVYGDAVELQDH